MSLSNGGIDRTLILTGDGECITMIINDPGNGGAESVDVDPHTWATITSRALSESPDMLLELSTLDCGPKDWGALEFDVDDHLLSLYHLATIVYCRGGWPIVEQIANCWMCLPRDVRATWRHRASSDKPIHAQLLPTIYPASPVFRTEVPTWLPRLIDVGDFRRGIIGPSALHWAYSLSPLGTSCIAFLDDESDTHDACLALSDCLVSCGAADGSMRQPALTAVDQLTACHSAVLADRTLAGEVGWYPNAHDLLDIGATLDEWRSRIERMAA